MNERSIKWKSLREGANALGDGSLVGLKIATINKYSLVFVISENSLSSHILDGGNVLRKIVHDAKGCNRNCWSFKPEFNQLIVTNEVRLYLLDLFFRKWSISTMRSGSSKAIAWNTLAAMPWAEEMTNCNSSETKTTSLWVILV